MMLTRTAGALGALTLLAATFVATAAPASANHQTRIKLTEIETSYAQSFDEDEYPEVGDSFRFTSKLKQNGTRVGSDKGRCVFKDLLGEGDEPTGAVVRCRVTLTLKGGTMLVVGKTTIDFSDDGEPFTVPIVDGTGKYRNVTGKLKVRQVSDTKSKLTITYAHS